MSSTIPRGVAVILCSAMLGCARPGAATSGSGRENGTATRNAVPAPADTAAPVQTDRRGYSLRDVDPGTLGLHIGATYHNRSGHPVAVARCGTRPPDFYLEKRVDGRWIRAYQPNCVQVRVAGALVVRPGERLPLGITIHTAPIFRSSVFTVEEIPGRYRIVVQLHAVGDSDDGAEMAEPLPKEAGVSNEFQITGPDISPGGSLRP
jgi:hypothetical protein